MGQELIAGVELIKHDVFSNEKGKLFHHTRVDSPFFKDFGEVYISQTSAGVVKGWKLHKELSQLMSVPVGRVLFVLKDLREGSHTYGIVNQLILGPDEYQVLKMPSNIWYGFQTISENDSLIVNLTDLPHKPDESIALELDSSEINFSDWH
jgi:dTDP-4-dehydrorhamnose 3,5-epimerase